MSASGFSHGVVLASPRWLEDTHYTQSLLRLGSLGPLTLLWLLPMVQTWSSCCSNQLALYTLQSVSFFAYTSQSFCCLQPSYLQQAGCGEMVGVTSRVDVTVAPSRSHLPAVAPILQMLQVQQPTAYTLNFQRTAGEGWALSHQRHLGGYNTPHCLHPTTDWHRGQKTQTPCLTLGQLCGMNYTPDIP